MHCDLSSKEATTSAPNATTTVAMNITQGGPLWWDQTGEWQSQPKCASNVRYRTLIAFVHKSIVSTLTLQSRMHPCPEQQLMAHKISLIKWCS